MMVNCSIVTYKTDKKELEAILGLLKSCEEIGEIYVIDNTDDNVGYGRGHNKAFEKTLSGNAEYHLVVNTDIKFTPDVITRLVTFMNEHKDVGQVMPRVLNNDGTDQHLAKRLPTPWDLIHRRLFGSHRCELELPQRGFYDVKYLSGCFMFLRVEAMKRLKELDGYLFDPRFFMYPEDIDFTRRMSQVARTIYLPEVNIIHDHKRESYETLKMTRIHAWNMLKYFWKWRGNWR
ncbi:MAG: glycosyltransferase family 2 protein [bacterium]|nr:glycosyltransferase family 2 protein [Candidatus Minthenecus merdequi]